MLAGSINGMRSCSDTDMSGEILLFLADVDNDGKQLLFRQFHWADLGDTTSCIIDKRDK
jgi:hypothetical protein